MEPDFYQIDVIHYLNPHLLWVEVVNSKQEDIVFEQIGICGVLPLEPVLDMDGSVGTRKCDKWMPAAAVVMYNAFSDAKEVWFMPTHIDRRSSIFDNNIHKYGNIIIKKTNGKSKDMTKQLLKSGFAFQNVPIFHQELASGNLKTKLDKTKTQEIVKHLKLYYKQKNSKDSFEKSIKNQMSIYEMTHNFESNLTARNLEKHNRANMKKLLEDKLKDFERCKDVEEISVGRANCKKNFTTNKTVGSSLLKRKLAAGKVKFGSQDVDLILTATKKFLEANAEIKTDLRTNSTDKAKSELTNDDNQARTDSVIDSSNSTKEDVSEDNSDKVDCNKISHIDVKVSRTEDLSSVNMVNCIKSIKTNTMNGGHRTVAYGPPDIPPTKLIITPHSELKMQKDLNNSQIKIDDTDDGDFPQYDKLGEDSDINVPIKNLDLLKCEVDEPALITNNMNIVKNENAVKTNSSVLTDDCINEEISKEIPALDKSKDNISTTSTDTEPKTSKLLQKKLRRHKELQNIENLSDTSKSIEVHKQTDQDSEEDIEELVKKLDLKTNLKLSYNISKDNDVTQIHVDDVKINVNPFKNLDGSKSVFVDKLVSPILLVHTKKNNRIQPRNNIRDVPFSAHIQIALKNMHINEMTRLQSVSYYNILRGHSTFLISPLDSGKTMGYLPAICQLVADSVSDAKSSGPSCIIVCATAKSVADVEIKAKILLGLREKVLACYSGMNEIHLITSLLNGCDLLITTPCLLVRLLQAEFGIDLRRLTTLVLDDCERLLNVYINEVKFIFYQVKELLKSRANKELNVQVIVASRNWCDYLEKLAKKAPDTVVCFGAFQECVLYSKVKTTVDFIKKDNKIKLVLDFLKDIDTTKRTVIVFRNNDEIHLLEKSLKKAKYVIFTCNSTMTVQELYSINIAWADYREPVLGPILLCCDDNLSHLNITDAHYLLHYSLPDKFSSFCRRFAVLIDNYPSLFKENNESIKIKVLLEEENLKELPKILHFCKNSTDNIPEVLDVLSEKILAMKDVLKAKNFVPICDNLLAFGECPDFWNCLERHAILKEYDEPKEWMPTEGTITFKVLYYHTPALLSASLLTNTVENQTTKYAQTYSTLSLKMGRYYSRAGNKRLHGIPKVGDICAVAIKQNFFERCQVLKIVRNYTNGNPKYILIKLIDEERFEMVKDIYLYYLPDELKNIETPVIRVRLANVQPKDKDVTFPDLATAEFRKILEKDDTLFLRGQVTLAIGNCVFVDTLEACQELTSLNETVVKHNFKKKLLDKYAVPKMDHIPTLQNLCESANIKKHKVAVVETPKVKPKFKGRWAYLESGISQVYFTAADTPNKFFVRLAKFEKCINDLIKDIKKYVEENPEPLKDVEKGDIVIAKFPDDNTYERARVDEICDTDKVKCFFVDNGDWRFVSIKDLVSITANFVDKIPFQAIECSLVGIGPVGDSWSEFSTNWLCDNCYDSNGDVKQLYIKYFGKEKAEITDGNKYSVTLVDTYGNEDIIINEMMVLLNLAKANNEFEYVHDVIKNKAKTEDSDQDTVSDINVKTDEINNGVDSSVNSSRMTDISSLDSDIKTKGSIEKFTPSKLIRSIPLVNDDPVFDPDRWDVYNPKEVVQSGFNSNEVPSVENLSKSNEEENSTDALSIVKYSKDLGNNDEKLNIVTEDTNSNTVFKDIANKKSRISLDSDDVSTADTSESEPIIKEIVNSKDIKDDKNKYIKVMDETRKPKLCWRQNKSNVYIKIMLIGVENYSFKISERSIKFLSYHNDLNYSFDFELYGGVHKEKCSHSNKGQYILVILTKIMQRNWLTLTKDGGIRKWIVYDMDSIDTSSDEEEIDTSNLELIKKMHEEKDSESDDDFLDDSNISYRKSGYIDY